MVGDIVGVLSRRCGRGCSTIEGVVGDAVEGVVGM